MLVNWWKNETKKAFEEKQKCIVEQYGNFSEPSVKIYLNGKNTLGENIADNGKFRILVLIFVNFKKNFDLAGVKVAYHAYKKYITKYGPEQKLPGIKYTPSQLFWISGAQVWCSVFRPGKEFFFHSSHFCIFLDIFRGSPSCHKISLKDSYGTGSSPLNII